MLFWENTKSMNHQKHSEIVAGPNVFVFQPACDGLVMQALQAGAVEILEHLQDLSAPQQKPGPPVERLE